MQQRSLQKYLLWPPELPNKSRDRARRWAIVNQNRASLKLWICTCCTHQKLSEWVKSTAFMTSFNSHQRVHPKTKNPSRTLQTRHDPYTCHNSSTSSPWIQHTWETYCFHEDHILHKLLNSATQITIYTFKTQPSPSPSPSLCFRLSQ